MWEKRDALSKAKPFVIPPLGRLKQEDRSPGFEAGDKAQLKESNVHRGLTRFNHLINPVW